jgi:hypothetical protein
VRVPITGHRRVDDAIVRAAMAARSARASVLPRWNASKALCARLTADAKRQGARSLDAVRALRRRLG